MRLATRNVFLNRSLSAKIAGFGPRQGDDDDESGKKVCVDFVDESNKITHISILKWWLDVKKNYPNYLQTKEVKNQPTELINIFKSIPTTER